MGRNLRSKLKEEELRKLYLKERMSLEDIARLYGVSRVAVWKYCQAAQLTRRSKSEARLEAQKRGKVPQQYFHINEGFFSTWSAEVAYVLGLLMTDGCLSKVKGGSYSIRLCLNDKELLEKVAKALGSEHILSSSNWQKGLHMFIIGREKMAQDLLKLGMKPRKSLNIRFPEVPEAYLRDFIRGVFDGDGSVYFNTQNPEYPLITKFVGGSKAFITGLEARLQGLGMPKRTIYKQKGKNPSYMFRYGHKASLGLFKVLYEGVKNGLYLDRKYDKFREGVNHGKAY